MKNQDVSIFSVEAGSGHICELSKAIRKYCNLTTVWNQRSAYGFDDIEPYAKLGVEYVPLSGDHLIVVGVLAYQYLKGYIEKTEPFWEFLERYEQRTIIVTDGGMMRRRDYYNSAFRNWNVFATPCKIQFCKNAKEYYQPFDIDIPIRKDKNLLVGHSPFGKSKWREKGTGQIIEECDYSLSLITQVSWAESLKRKAKCHIFVDQIDHFDGHKFGWRGGIGKSGYEAMLLDCLVISRGKFVGIEIPTPPIAWCTKENFKEVLDYYATHPKERNEKIKDQREWADKYLKPDFHAKRVLQIQ